MFQIDPKLGILVDEQGLPVSRKLLAEIRLAWSKWDSMSQDQRELTLRRMLDDRGSLRDQVNLQAYL